MDPTFLDLADEWAATHRGVLREAGEYWLQHGKWMTVMQLGRSALRRSEERDVFAALRELPAPLGHVAHPGDTVVLRVRALAAVPQARPLLEAFVRTLSLAKLRLLADDDERPLLCSRDLMETLGMSSEAAKRVSTLILGEDWMFGGGSGTQEGEWEREIDERTRVVMGVKSVADYLQLEGQRLWSRSTVRSAALPLAASVVSPSPRSVAAIDVADLHPAIAAAAAQLIAGGHFDAAVRAGAIAFRDALRDASGHHDLDGVALAGAALGGHEPAIVLADLATVEGKGEQDGWRMLAQGCFAAVRNPVAHRHVYTDRVSATEALAPMSLIARVIERAEDPRR